MICLVFASDDIIAGKQTTKQPAECNDKHRNRLLKHKQLKLEMWANAQRDGRPAEYRWRPLFNATKYG